MIKFPHGILTKIAEVLKTHKKMCQFIGITMEIVETCHSWGTDDFSSDIASTGHVAPASVSVTKKRYKKMYKMYKKRYLQTDAHTPTG